MPSSLIDSPYLSLQNIPPTAVRLVDGVTASLQKLPGSAIVVRYIRSSYQDDPIRSLVELFLFIFAVRYLLAPAYSTKKTQHVPLGEDEIEELVEDWTPEPLTSEQTELERLENERRPVIVGPSGPRVKLQGGRTVTNLASANHYNFAAHPELTQRAIDTVRTYGVGPCSPPGFYGTQDVHMKSEADIATHVGLPAAIIYAQSFSTISSVIPAFCKRGDIIVADRAVNHAIRKGMQIARSTVRWFEHNDMDDLERVLARVVHEGRGKPLTRRFIVTEGLFETTGNMVPLPRLVELKTTHRFRLLLDETLSYGVLGATGRGVTEHLHVDPTHLDMMIGGLAGALAAGGGFCAATHEIVEHQRLSAAAYTFSAALPALLAVTASATVALLQSNPQHIRSLRENTHALRAALLRPGGACPDLLRCTSHPDNPIQLLVLPDPIVAARRLSRADQDALLQDVLDEALSSAGLLLARLRVAPSPNVARHHHAAAAAAAATAAAANATPRDMDDAPRPALKVFVSAALSRRDMEKAASGIRNAAQTVLKGKRWQRGEGVGGP